MEQIDTENQLHPIELEGLQSTKICGYTKAARKMYLEGEMKELNSQMSTQQTPNTNADDSSTLQAEDHGNN